MDIISGLGAATEGLKLLNELRKVDKELDKAELKLRLAEVVDKLLDSKQALQEAKDMEFELRKKIDELEKKISASANLRDKDGLLFEVDERGNAIGEPYCNYCYVKEDKKFRLKRGDYDFGSHYCRNCNSTYGERPSTVRSGLQTGWDVSDPYRDG